MAVVRIPDEGRSFREDGDVARALAAIGIDFFRVDVPPEVASAPADHVLEAFDAKLSELKSAGGYVTADVIDVSPATPNLDAMLAKFSREHWHDEDEVRLVVSGSGLFHVRPKEGGPIHAIEVSTGDAIRVPAGTLHWFDLCATRAIRAVRLFQDPSGWTPHYTESGAESSYQPVCLGPAYIGAAR
jgi:1,2-dihydroxy-3-keto-5-methylthiopentene dioxygenase